MASFALLPIPTLSPCPSPFHVDDACSWTLAFLVRLLSWLRIRFFVHPSAAFFFFPRCDSWGVRGTHDLRAHTHSTIFFPTSRNTWFNIAIFPFSCVRVTDFDPHARVPPVPLVRTSPSRYSRVFIYPCMLRPPSRLYILVFLSQDVLPCCCFRSAVPPSDCIVTLRNVF